MKSERLVFVESIREWCTIEEETDEYLIVLDQNDQKNKVFHREITDEAYV